MNVPWMPKKTISESASRVISAYKAMIGDPIKPPIPIEDIIERYLGVNLSFEDLGNKLGIKDVLGATYVNSRLICINEKLVEGRSEGRLAFTCAHEAGHWVLHRPYIDYAIRVGQRCDSIICRLKNCREPIEWQADYFAACLLMSEKEVKDAFRKVCGTERLVVENVKSAFGGTAFCVDPCVENWHFIAFFVCEAGGFTNVSKQAMAIRMQELGLLVNVTGVPIGWQESRSTA